MVVLFGVPAVGLVRLVGIVVIHAVSCCLCYCPVWFGVCFLVGVGLVCVGLVWLLFFD